MSDTETRKEKIQRAYDEGFEGFLKWAKDNSNKRCSDAGLGNEFGVNLRNVADSSTGPGILKAAYHAGWSEHWARQPMIPLEPAGLCFNELRKQNVARCEDVFHPLHSWSLGDWGVALAGEVGEACNIIKKLRRGEGEQTRLEVADFQAALAKEFADIAIYLDLLAARAGVDLGEAVRAKFNEVSAKRGSKIKL